MASLLFEVKPTDRDNRGSRNPARTRRARGLLHSGAPRDARGSYGCLEIRVVPGGVTCNPPGKTYNLNGPEC